MILWPFSFGREIATLSSELLFKKKPVQELNGTNHRAEFEEVQKTEYREVV